MRNLSADSSYLIKLAAQNEFGMGEFDQYHSAVQTLKVRPCFYRTILPIKFTDQIYRSNSPLWTFYGYKFLSIKFTSFFVLINGTLLFL